MPDTPQPAPLALAAQRIDELAAAVTALCGAPLTATAQPIAEADLAELQRQVAGAGIVVRVGAGAQRVVGLLDGPAFEGWRPDASQLASLAQHVGRAALGDERPVAACRAEAFDFLAVALAGLDVEPGAAVLEVRLDGGDAGTTRMRLVAPASIREQAAAVPEPPPPPTLVQQGASSPELDRLPRYTRSLLRIRVPVVVTLASRRQPIAQVLELGPGSIIQFDKACDELLDVEVGGQVVARGDTVKVGDKFGVRIASMVLPRERFRSVRPGDR